jgi:hypothetical protein
MHNHGVAVVGGGERRGEEGMGWDGERRGWGEEGMGGDGMGGIAIGPQVG